MNRTALFIVAGIAGLIAAFGLIIFILTLQTPANPSKAIPLLAFAIGTLVALIAFRGGQRLGD